MNDEKDMKMYEKNFELCKDLARMELEEFAPTICMAVDLWCKARGNKVTPKQLITAIASLVEVKGDNNGTQGTKMP